MSSASNEPSMKTTAPLSNSTTRARQFGRGLTVVTVGLIASLSILIADGSNIDGVVVALLIAAATLYPGFTLVGLAIFRD